MEKNKKKKVLILVVEDEKVLVDVIEEKLKTEGFEVIKAYDGNEALKIALSSHPDMILLDILMPEADGITMLKKLREDDWGKYANIMILTNVQTPNMIVKSMTYGLDGIQNTYEYLVKTDWSLDAIVKRIKERLKI